MIDQKIMYEIVEKLHENFPFPVSICDVSGRVIISTEPACIGEMNLLAIESLNINAKATASSDSLVQKAGSAMPLRFQKSRIGAVVIEHTVSSNFYTAELLGKTIELLYEDLLLSKERKNRTQERDQFLFEWLHQQSGYTENFIKRGELLKIDITGIKTVILMEQISDSLLSPAPVLHNLLDDQDILLSLSRDQTLIILKENKHLDKKYNRVLAAGSGCHIGICSGVPHLNTAYQNALKSLELGKLLFPDETVHHFEKMKLAIMLSQEELPGIETAFSLLVEKGKNARLAETAVTYIRFSGDIQRISEQLHIHRNSIPYRLRRIQEICGKDLTNYYDLLSLYASFIRYMGQKLPDFS